MAITAAFTSAVDNTVFNSISIIEVALDGGSVYYSDKAVTGVSAIKNYLTKPLTNNPSKIDAKRASSSFGSMSASILDKDQEITASMAAESWVNKTVTVYAFYDGLTWPTDRVTIFTGKINSVKAPNDGATWMISIAEEREQIGKPLFQNKSNLATAITTTGQTTGIYIDSSTQLDSAGTLRIGNEYLTYTSISGDELQGVGRATNGSTAATHVIDSEVANAYIISANPIDIMLQLLLSIIGDGTNNVTYDVLKDGVGLATASVDVSTFETIRDSNSFGTYSFIIYEGMDDAMKFIEQELLLSTNTRIVTTFEGLISLTQLGKLTFGTATETITEAQIIGNPTMKIDVRNIVNQLDIQYNYNTVTSKYRGTLLSEDTASVATYGKSAKSIKKFKFKGVTSATVINQFVTNYFKRNATPAPDITLKSFLSKRVVNPGDVVQVQAKNVPNLSVGNREFNAQLELMQSRYSADSVAMTLSYTNFQPGRLAWIAPARAVDSKASEVIFDLTAGGGSKYVVGWRVILWDVSTNTAASTYRTITAINTDTVTIDTAFDVTLKTNGDHYLRFPDYDDTVETQQLYAFISTTPGADFADGTATYTIQE